jgi:hypothetical protein
MSLLIPTRQKRHNLVTSTTSIIKNWKFRESNRNPIEKTYLLVKIIPAQKQKLPKHSKRAKFFDFLTFLAYSLPPIPLLFIDILL